MAEKCRIGIIGCGNISTIYLQNFTNLFSDKVEVVGCADIDQEKSRSQAEKFGMGCYSVDELLQHPDIQGIVNLTIPKAHKEVNLEVLGAGKHVYTEKPLGVTREDGLTALNKAAEKGLRVGAAPDTVLGAGIQTCRKLIDAGVIGQPVGASAFMMYAGPEKWHPSPEFYFKVGGGPMFDMGPYYLSALVNLLGPVKEVTGITATSFSGREILSEPLKGKIIDVEIPTHVTGLMQFSSGAVGTIVTSFDVWSHHMPCIEIYGSRGSISVPDPNTFGGPIEIKLAGDSEWHEVELEFSYPENSRGLGMVDMMIAQTENRPHRANGQLAYHVLDLMHAFHEASIEQRHISITSSCEQPEIMPVLGF
ncbi:MAG: Gfo/Idh/MocA family oxidoreductase [Anaerolineales bacterium]|nr:Gfo/Idh/MocA family oxidoreductase [Anaerolineales bacterium]